MERTAEAIGADIAAHRQHEIRQAVQLDLPVNVSEPIPILYVQMDGTGVPVVKKETEGRKGKTDAQPAHTREVKLECVFTQTTHDEEGSAIRDPDSTTCAGAIETAEQFGRRLYLEAWNRGWSRAERKVVISDGAPARQHLWDLARTLHPNDPMEQNTWTKGSPEADLDKGKIEKLVLLLRSTGSPNAVIGSRLKQSGMIWTVSGANSIIALQCCQLNGRFESCWSPAVLHSLPFHVAHPSPVDRNRLILIWWRRGGVEVITALKIRNLLILLWR